MLQGVHLHEAWQIYQLFSFTAEFNTSQLTTAESYFLDLSDCHSKVLKGGKKNKRPNTRSEANWRL